MVIVTIRNISGIAIYRLFLVKFPCVMAEAKQRFKIMALIQAICILFYAIIFVGVTVGVTAKASLVFSCFHMASSSMKITEGLVMILMSMTLLEMVIYGTISYELYKHDKLMKMVLSDEVIKQRHIKNVINLMSQICRFILEILFTLSLFIHAKYVNEMAAFSTGRYLRAGIYHIIMQGLWAIIHLSLSQPLKIEIFVIINSLSNNIWSIFRKL